MPRKRVHDKGLPTRVYRKGRSYYYVTTESKWMRLGQTEEEMYRTLAAIKAGLNRPTLRDLWERYEREVLPSKKPKTQYEQRRNWVRLEEVFGATFVDEVLPVHVARYLDKRTKKVVGNREIALLSHMFRKAMRWGLVNVNPCVGVDRNPEQPDTRYITNAEFWAVHDAAPAHVQLAMELALITGQRQADILALRRDQLIEDGIGFKQAKTGRQIVVEWSAPLRAVIDRAIAVEASISSVWVLHNRQGQRFTSSGFQSTWQRLMRRCLERGLIAERFTFRAIRAKARSEASDKRLLGHSNPEAMARFYQRTPELVTPNTPGIRNDLEKKGAS